jgi:S-layer protein
MFGKLITGGTLDAEINTAVIDLLEGLLKAGTTKAEGFVAVIDFLSNSANTLHPDLGDIAQSFQNRADAAEYFSITKELGGSTDAELAAAIASVTSDAATLTAANAAADATADAEEVVAGQTFTLTTNLDNVPGGAGDDTIIGNSATGVQTLGALDTVDGGEGTDSLSVTATADIASISPAGSTIKNVENITLISNGSVTASSAAATGATKLIATSGDEFALTAAVTTDVIATSSDLAADNASVSGGKDITVTVAKGAAGTLSVGSATTAGAIAVDATYTAAATGGAVTLAGGTSITADLKAGNAVNTTSTFGAIGATGGAATTEISISQSAKATASATKVGVVNGAVTVADANAASATKAGTLTTVTLSSYANSTIDSGALTDVHLSGTGGTLGITAGALTVPAVTALNIHANTAAVGAITVDADYKTVTIDSSTKASTIGNVTASGATTVNVTGDAKLTLSDNTFAAATSIVVTNTAGATFGTTALNAAATFTGGAGAETVIAPNALTKAIALGDGADTLVYGGAVGLGGSVNAGDGTDIISMTAAQAATADNSAVFNSTFTGFEVLALSTAASGTLVLAGLGNVSTVALAAGGDNVATAILEGLASGGTVQQTGNGTGFVVNVTNALFNAADSINLVLDKATALTTGTVTAAAVETVNITTPDSGTASAAAIHTATLVATSAKTVTVSGNNGLNLTNTGNTKITSFDASGVVGNSTATVIDTAANLGVTFASANTTATATVTITGGAGNDTLTGNAAKDTINGGAGADIISGGTGVDTLTVGTGRDIVKFASTAGTSTDSGTAAFDTVTGFNTATAAIASVDLSSDANIIASTAGGANLSVLSIDATTAAAGNQALAVEANGTGAGVVTGVTYTVKNGILTLGGSGVGAIDTLGEWQTEAAAVAATLGDILAFEFSGNTYVFAENGDADVFVSLVGVTGATSLVETSATTTAAIGTILFADVV